MSLFMAEERAFVLYQKYLSLQRLSCSVYLIPVLGLRNLLKFNAAYLELFSRLSSRCPGVKNDIP